MNYCIHHTMCTLEAFNQQDEEALLQSIESNVGFSDVQLRTHVDPDELYKQAGIKRNDAFNWENSSPLRFFESEESVVAHMHALLKPNKRKELDLSNVPEDAAAEYKAMRDNAILEAQKYRHSKAELERSIIKADIELQQLQRLSQEVAHRRVAAAAKPLTVTDPEQLEIAFVGDQASQTGRRYSRGDNAPISSVTLEATTSALAIRAGSATPAPPPTMTRTGPANPSSSLALPVTSVTLSGGFEDARMEIQRVQTTLSKRKDSQLAGSLERNRGGPDDDEDAPPQPPPKALTAPAESRSSSAPPRGERHARDREVSSGSQRRVASGSRGSIPSEVGSLGASLESFEEARDRIRQARALAAGEDAALVGAATNSAAPRPHRSSKSSRHRYQDRYEDLHI